MGSQDLATRREAYERRVWHLATLLSGDQDRAAALALRIVDTRAALEELDAPRLDRLVILTARRWRDEQGAAQPPPGDAAAGADGRGKENAVPEALAILEFLRGRPFQHGEVWILRRVDALEDIRASQAMDCSRSAAGRFLERAEEELEARFRLPSEDLAAIVRAYADRLEPAPVLSAHRAGRARRRRRRRAVVVIAVIGAALFGLLVLLRWVNQTQQTLFGVVGV